jgi:TRAP transporter 4TM/12TM fusion protein
MTVMGKNFMTAWEKLRTAVNTSFLVVGTVLTFYVGIATFGLIKNASEHYSNFILGTVLMTGLLAIRDLCDEKIEDRVKKFFAARMVFSVIAFVMSGVAMSYIRINAVELATTQPFFNNVNMIFGWLMTISILALTLIHWGLLLTSVISIAITYFFFGYMIENPLFMTPHYDNEFIMNYIGLGTNQGFYYLAQVAADSIYFLIIYAAILLGVGMLKMVLEVGKLAGRRIPGGAAGPAIIGSGIVASIMGQAVSNVVLTGRFTIPMMKKYGYKASMAGAIEATASTAGQIMPPIMGLAAFIIASFLNRPYIDIALSALIPGVLYLVGVSIAVIVYAHRYNLPKLNASVDTMMIKRMLPTFIISFGAVLWLLLGYHSPAIAGLAGIVLAFAVCLFQGKYRPNKRQLYEAIEEGFYLVSILSLLLIAIGPLGQVMLTTNLSGRLGAILVQYLPNSQLLMLLGAMVVSLILGMGLPTPVAYVIVALALVPFMQQIGIPPLQAHFFVFYFAVFSTLTPPVAISVLAAGKLAGASVLATAKDSLKIAMTTFIIPFAFIFSPELMTFPNMTWAVVPAILEVIFIQWMASIASFGYIFRPLAGWERGLFAGVFLLGFLGMTLTPQYWYAGGVLFLAAGGYTYLTKNRKASVDAVVDQTG